MRPLLFAALLPVLVAGCDAKDAAPEQRPTPASTAPETRPSKPEAALVRGAPTVLFASKTDAIRAVGAVRADATKPAVALSRPGVDTTFAASLPGRRVLLLEHAADGSVAALALVEVDGAARTSLGTLPAGQYRGFDKVRPLGDALVVELARVGSHDSDVLVLRAGEEPRLLAALARLSLVGSGRVAVLAAGNLRSVKLDGTGAIALGAGDGKDRVADVRGERLLLTTHGSGAGDVRAVDIDGGNAVDLGAPDADEIAVAFSDAGRAVFARRGASGAVLISVAPEGKAEAVLTTPDLDATPLRVIGERVLFTSQKGALMSVDAAGGAPVVLDAAAGQSVRIGAVRDGKVVYRCENPHWPALRVAALDGSGAVSLIEEPPSLPFFSGLTEDGRVVYYRTLAGQLEGGRIHSMKLDGSDRRSVGNAIHTSDGQPTGKGVADQDFEAISGVGQVILETEFATGNEGSNLLVGAADSEAARLLPGTARSRFVALVE